MTELLAADYSYAHPNPGALAAAGYSAVLRYVSTDPAKDLSPGEASLLHSNALGIGLVYETTAQRAYGSSAAGEQDGAAMVVRMRQLGCPPGTPALVNVGDWAVLPQQVGAIESYYAAWREQLAEYQPGAGGYGTAGIITYLSASYPHDIWWQNAIDDLGKSGSVVSQMASIYQRVRPTTALAGSGIDEDAYGFGPRPVLDWWGPGTPIQPTPQPTPTADWWPTMPELSQGSAGAAVRTLQGLLVARYFHIGSTGAAADGIDGAFGPLVNAAVRTFQGQHGLTVDGIVGPKTWPALAGIS